MSSEGRTAQSHRQKGAGHVGKVTIFGFGCPWRDDRRCNIGAGWRRRSLGTIPNHAESLRKLIKKLGPAEKLRGCYEAGSTGYAIYWQLAELGGKCEVIAPTLVPVKAGDRVKTDRRDAEKLARCYRSGDLTAVWGPDEGSEELRDLVRARSSQAGSVEGTASAEQVSTALRPAPTVWNQAR